MMHEHYDGWIVLLSVLISIGASFLGLNIASRVYRASGLQKLLWLFGGSTIMGLGIWSMHFIGMLAFHSVQALAYDPALTLLSAVISCIGAFVAFYLATHSRTGMPGMWIGGVSMALAVLMMHFIGMAAMRMDAQMTFDPLLTGISVLIAFAASFTALMLFRKFRYSIRFSYWKVNSALLMGAGVSGMHYTGMAAVQFTPYQGPAVLTDSGYITFLLILISAAATVILMVTMGALFYERHLLEKMAYHDSLTALPNRNGMMRYTESSLDRHWRGAVLFIDLDRFKSVNDLYGHDVGDMLLQVIADRFREAAGQQALVYRLGGDEFVALVPQANREQAGQLADRFISTIHKPVLVEGYKLMVSGSIGISMAPEHGQERNVLLRAADTAMYHVKKTGKDRYSFFDDQMAQEQARRLRLERDLQLALHRSELRIVYQPKWDARYDRLAGMEALLRWEHPELGSISPGEFIPIAEENGVILTITAWMLNEVCLQNAAWQKAGLAAVPVSVNISSHVLDSFLMVSMIDRALQDSGLPASALELEIKESVAMSNLEQSIEQLGRLQSRGVRISMDDFGTGYSSLGRIGDIPFHTLKIDRSFIQQSSLFFKQAIIRNMVAIAGNLNLGIIAEGVETKEQAEFLMTTGCYQMQGFYFGVPMDADSMDKWLHGGGAAGRLAAAGVGVAGLEAAAALPQA
ncbi:putative bifunctional diguanylate cyclase/phosphodiesterase [Paenibacillus sp. JSM ZJ436]